jgi:fumarate hydratase class II
LWWARFFAPHIGYDHAAEIAKRAHRDGNTPQQAQC